MAAFQYDPLDLSTKSIRLLEILPGSGDEPIRLQTSISDLDDQPPFIALSYTWNHGGDYTLVKCNNADFRVGDNLRSFLHRYRERKDVKGTPDGRLWIDAICRYRHLKSHYSNANCASGINQRDVQERNHQVAQMRDVYSGATSVIAWLGESTPDDASIFARVSPEVRFQPWDNLTDRLTTSFLSKLYFSRIWIVQEVILARSLEFWCGEHRANADVLSAELLRFIAPFISFDERPSNVPENAKAWESPGRVLLSYRKIWREGSPSRKFDRSFRVRALLEAFAGLQCSEKLDKVYALLGIAMDASDGPFPIRPDYDKSPIEVLVDILRNQRGRRSSKDLEEHEFIDSLRQMLGISRKDLVKYLAYKFADLEQHMFVIGTGILPTATLRFIDTVARWSHAAERDGRHEQPTSSERLVVDAHATNLDHTITSDAGYRWHKLGNRPHFQAVTFQSSTALVDHISDQQREAANSGDLQKYRSHDIDVYDILSQSFVSGAGQCSDAIQEDAIPRDSQKEAFGMFVGMKGLSGIVYGEPSRTWNGASIAVFAGATQPRNALVLQQTTENSWYIVGVARFLVRAPQPTSRGIWDTILSSSGTLRHVLNGMFDGSRLKKPKLAKESNEGKPCIKVCLQYCGLIDLLDLCRCEVLDQYQLRQILKKTVEMELLDGLHQCNEGAEGCNVLRVGTTWSG